MAAGVVPQSSCSFRPMAPASTCSRSGSRQAGVALAEEAEVHRERLGRLQHAVRCATAPACRWSRWCRWPGPVPPPIIVVTPRHQRLLDLLRADEMDVRVDAAGGDDHALAGDDLGAGADRRCRRRAGCRDCRPCRCRAMRPSLMPMSALTMPQWSTISALVITVSATSRRDALALAHAVADHLAAAELHLLAVDR